MIILKTDFSSRLRKLIYSALFAALCFVVTYMVIIPLPHGYVNAGDVFVLLAGFCLGPIYGGVAAALGSALADLASGYALYAPATALIKFAVAASAVLLYRGLRRPLSASGWVLPAMAVSCVIGESIMIGGYFLYECCLYGIAGASLSVAGNALQGLCCAVAGVLLCAALRAIVPVRRVFPDLGR